MAVVAVAFAKLITGTESVDDVLIVVIGRVLRLGLALGLLGRGLDSAEVGDGFGETGFAVGDEAVIEALEAGLADTVNVVDCDVVGITGLDEGTVDGCEVGVEHSALAFVWVVGMIRPAIQTRAGDRL